MKLIFFSIITLTISSLPAYTIDLNSNGVDDIFEALHPEISSTNLADDTDGDGIDNLSEARALTSPTNPSDYLKCLPLTETSTTYTVKWPSKEGLRYQAQHSNDGQSWNFIGTPSTGTGGILFSTISKSSLPQSDRDFFRARVTGAIDTDNDGVPDWTELLLGLSPTNSASVRSSAQGGDLQQITNLLTGANAQGGLAGTSSTGIPSEEHASRFLAQATFGPRIDDITSLRTLGSNAYEKWIDSQISLPASFTYPYILHTYNTNQADRARVDANEVFSSQLPYSFVNLDFLPAENLYTPWMRNAINGPDQLRQRIAWALSQIMVVSQNDSNLTFSTPGLSHYYDHLIQHSFGNYSDLLTGVAKHPVMGIYLSHLFNEKADPSLGISPDENFAREIMQLFSIGLFDLNLDGTQVLDENGTPKETYDNQDIEALARIFTGQKIAGKNFGSINRNDTVDLTQFMDWDASRKDFGPKTFLRVRGLEITENSDHYILNWPTQNDLYYMPQYLDANGLWSDLNPVMATGNEPISQEVSKSLVGEGRVLDDFRVKHHFPQPGIPFSFFRTPFNYAFTVELEPNTIYETSFLQNGSPDQIISTFNSANLSGTFTILVSLTSIPDGTYTADDFSMVSTSNRTAQEELDLLVHILTTHPNAGPFFAKQLIKHLITSNPSNSYVERVASIFKDNGNGTTGDLAATVKAALLDPEARGLRFLVDPSWGKLKEPMLRLTQFARIFASGRNDNYDSDPVDKAEHYTQLQWWDNIPDDDFSQSPFSAPNVFNFYQPDYSHPGILADSSLASPEFQILDARTSTLVPNRFHSYLTSPYHNNSAPNTPIFENDFSTTETTFLDGIPFTFSESSTHYLLTWNPVGGAFNFIFSIYQKDSSNNSPVVLFRPNSSSYTYSWPKSELRDGLDASNFRIVTSLEYDTEEYLNHLNLILASGTLKAEGRATLKNAFENSVLDPIQTSAYLSIIAPESAIQK